MGRQRSRSMFRSGYRSGYRYQLPEACARQGSAVRDANHRCALKQAPYSGVLWAQARNETRRGREGGKVGKQEKNRKRTEENRNRETKRDGRWVTWRAYISDLSLVTTTTHRQRLRAFGRRLCRSYGEEWKMGEWKMGEWKTDNDGPTQVDSLHPPNAIIQARQGHMARCNTHNGRINRNKESTNYGQRREDASC